MTTPDDTKCVAERDMTAHLRGLVDGCFEEGQYEAGLAALDQLRSPTYRPAPSHIRQLICISLRAPAPGPDGNPASPKKNKGKGVDPGSGTIQLPASINQQKSTFLPTYEATEAARRLLMLFALTNSPSSLFRALPSYPLDPDPSAVGGRVDGADLAYDGEDSYIARVAQCVGSAVNVWAVIRPGFVKWDSHPTSGVLGKTKANRRQARIKDESGDLLDNEPMAIVGDDAWAVLDWLLLIFDKDEQQAVKDRKPCHSPLLLSAIPSTRSMDPRRDTSAVLDVVFCCLSEQDEHRTASGFKLLHQLINLTSTTLFDLPLFVGALQARLPAEDWGMLSAFLANLPSSPTVLHFKLQLCMKYLDDVSEVRTAFPPRRAQPRARSARDQGANHADTQSAVKFIARIHSLPSWSATIEPLLLPPITDHPQATAYNKMKFELISTYGALQNLQLPNGRDAAWDTTLTDGTLRKIVGTAFGCGNTCTKDERRDSQVLGELLVHMIPSFRIAID